MVLEITDCCKLPCFIDEKMSARGVNPFPSVLSWPSQAFSRPLTDLILPFVRRGGIICVAFCVHVSCNPDQFVLYLNAYAHGL